MAARSRRSPSSSSRRSQSMVAAAVVVIALALALAPAQAQLSQSYYASTCPNVETLVRGAVTQKLQETFNAAPGTLRLFFHDCFVRVRSRLRRVGAAVGPRRRAQRRRRHHAVPRRAGPRHPRQGRRRRRPPVRQQGLLRRHPHARRPRRRLPDGRAVLPGGAGAAGRQGGHARRGEAQPPRRRLRPGPAQHPLRRQRAHADRHDRALRRAHHRRDALRQVRAAAVPVQGRRRRGAADEPLLPAADAADVPAELQPHGVRDAGRRHAAQVRQRLLPDAAADEGPAGVRPGALRRPPLQGHRQLLRRQPDRLLRRIRRSHGQARPRRGQDRRRRRDPPGLHQGQLAPTSRDQAMNASKLAGG